MHDDTWCSLRVVQCQLVESCNIYKICQSNRVNTARKFCKEKLGIVRNCSFYHCMFFSSWPRYTICQILLFIKLRWYDVSARTTFLWKLSKS